MTETHASPYVDVGAITIYIATLLQFMPTIAALLSVIWFFIRILESKSIQKLFGRYAWINPKEKYSDD